MLALSLMFATTLAYIWMCFDIGRRSVAGAVFTFLFAVPAIYFLLKGWRDRRHDIRPSFFSAIGGMALIACMAVMTQAPADETPQQTGTPVSVQMQG